MNAPTRLVLVGGFLGAGKTSLLRAAAERLRARGRRVGVVTNDQAAGLVDTAVLRAGGLAVREVAGSCFCCDFPGLIAAAAGARDDAGADVVLAEPVGSCTDLSATVLQPLKARFADAFRCAPLTVLADAARIDRCLDGGAGMHRDAAYIFRSQLAEADLIALSKADAVAPAALAAACARLMREFPGRPVLALSARDGAGVDAWLDALDALEAAGGVGRRIDDVDYVRYAAGEAALGWLNLEATLRSTGARDWRLVALNALDAVREACRAGAATIGHVKLTLRCGDARVSANLVDHAAPADAHGDASAIGGRAELVVNARVEMPPDQLEALVRAALAAACGRGVAIHVGAARCFSPAAPTPTHRYDTVV